MTKGFLEQKDIISLWIEVSTVPRSGSEIKDGLALQIEDSCFRRWVWGVDRVKEKRKTQEKKNGE